MTFWRSVVGKLWMTIIGLVAVVLLILGMFLLNYIDMTFANSNDVKRLFVYTGIIGFLLTTFFAFFLLTKITQPLRLIKKSADSISRGEYTTRVEVRSNDEIGDLAQTFNHMAEELERTIRDLNHEKEHLSSILRSMSDVVITFDAQGEVLLANPKGEKMIRDWRALTWMDQESNEGYQEILAVPETAERVSSFKRAPEPLLSLFKQMLAGDQEMTSNLHLHNEVWSIVMTPLYSNHFVRGAVAVLRNVTEEHRIEKLRKDFLANVSHELRTPLSMVQGYSEALLDNIATTPEERAELTQIILDESLRMSRLVHELLDLAKMEDGQLDLNLSDVDLPELLQRIYRKFSGVCREHEIDLQYIPETTEVHIRADEDRIEQVFTNLIDNAIRHTSSGNKIMITSQLTYRSQQQYMKIEVCDEGQGIAAEDVPFVFERFYKADKARKRGNEKGGTGLGLAIVRNIVEAHQGHISVESKIGQGTTFTVLLPVDLSRE